MTKDSEAANGTPEVVRAEVVDMAARPASIPKRDAVNLTNGIKKGLDDLENRRDAVLALVDEAYRGKAWAAMGYASWGQYTTQEFQMSRSRSYQLVNWAELNRELEAEGLPPAATEGEARKTRKSRKSGAAQKDGSGGESVYTVDTRAGSDQPERVPDIAGSVEERPPISETPPPPAPPSPPPPPPKAASAARTLEEQVHDLIDKFLQSSPEKVAALDADNPKLAASRAESLGDWALRYHKAARKLAAKGSKDPAKCQHPQSAHEKIAGGMVKCGVCGEKAWSGVSLSRMGEQVG